MKLSAPACRRTAAEPAVARPNVSHPRAQDASSAGESVEESPSPMAIGPMIAVFLDQTSVDKLKSYFPEAREGQLRKVVLQYGPSAAERHIYQHLFSGRAEVKVIGEAASFGRRALVASISHAGDVVEPMSLSSAIDISPASTTEETSMSQEDGPGPLASAVLVEQAKRAGATKKEEWQGMLPPLSAFSRQFPSEEGAYVRLEQPITVNGTICRADWVDGASTRCRDTLEGRKKRKEDWKPSHCSICAVFEASPCSNIFKTRFLPVSKRLDAHTKVLEAEDDEGQGDDAEDGVRESERQGEGDDEKSRRESYHVRGDTEGSSAEIDVTGRAQTAMATGENKGGAENGAQREVDSAGYEESAEEEDRQAGRDLIGQQLKADVLAAIEELRECMVYHDV